VQIEFLDHFLEDFRIERAADEFGAGLEDDEDA
jgi:hypothetical protein